MARIAGINVPDRKHTWVSLTSIYGIGRTRALAICEAVGLRPDARVADLTEEELDRLRAFEEALVADGALVLKFWMHLDREQQQQRFEVLEADPLQKWRVTSRDWKHFRMYDRFVAAAERMQGTLERASGIAAARRAAQPA